ncbi:SapC family protein [uncultured Ruegeria sp.]|uniref:SapC family protein n=1 Tax=uncultured Ruegeria sp. TaxID=259304 RepID=UPI00260CF995|nr:SapC family protein [uncultured Ruegeria sp.]
MAENGLFPISVGRHSDRYWRRFTSYRFAMGMNACPIVSSEIFQIASSFPIAFKLREGTYMPMAMFSVGAELATPIVDQQGRWRAPFIPSALRCYPFQTGPTNMRDCPTRERLCLYVNESSGLVTRDPRDNPFFSSRNKLSRNLCDVLQFLQLREAAAVEAHRLCSIVAEMDLFVPLQEHEGTTLPENYWCIDAQRLCHLPDVYKLTLVSSGALQLIHAHQISLSHLNWLARAQNALPGEHASASDTLNGFLTAMANDESHDQTRAEMIHAMG